MEGRLDGLLLSIKPGKAVFFLGRGLVDFCIPRAHAQEDFWL